MEAQLGNYFYGRHRNLLGIWQYTSVTDTSSSASFIKDVFSCEDARTEVYRLNGWGEPKTTKRNF